MEKNDIDFSYAFDRLFFSAKESANEYNEMRKAIVRHCLECRTLKWRSKYFCSACPFCRWAEKAIERHPEIKSLKWRLCFLGGKLCDLLIFTGSIFCFSYCLILFIKGVYNVFN